MSSFVTGPVPGLGPKRALIVEAISLWVGDKVSDGLDVPFSEPPPTREPPPSEPPPSAPPPSEPPPSEPPPSEPPVNDPLTNDPLPLVFTWVLVYINCDIEVEMELLLFE